MSLQDTIQTHLLYLSLHGSKGKVLKGVSLLRAWGKLPFQENEHENFKVTENQLYLALDCFHPFVPITRLTELPPSRARLGWWVGNQDGFLSRVEGRSREEIGLCSCQIYTCGKIANVSLTTITFQLILGKGCKISLSRFTGLFPQGWKMKCQSATEHPYLEGT